MPEMDIENLKRRMEASLSSLDSEFMGLRAGRANPAMLESILVDAYGSKMPLNQVGNVSAPEPRLLTISVWDTSMVSSVEKAIREADLGLNPMAEGGLIRVPIPDLSEERRKDLVKIAARYAEACRVAMRNVRRDGIEAARKAERESLISEDDRHQQESEVQKVTDTYVKRVDDALALKEKEITQV